MFIEPSVVFRKLGRATSTSALQCVPVRKSPSSGPGGQSLWPNPWPHRQAVLPSSPFRATPQVSPSAPEASSCAHIAPSARTPLLLVLTCLVPAGPDRCSEGPLPPGSTPDAKAVQWRLPEGRAGLSPPPGPAGLLLARSEMNDPAASSSFRLDTAPLPGAGP